MAKSRNQDTETTTRATDNVERAGTPKQGDVYRCDVCGMELEITTDCHCADKNEVHFQCCGQELAAV